MNVSAPFIQRPIGTTLLAVALSLAGIVAFRSLPVSALPQVDFPTVSVSGSLPGASPETMATSVATPLERRLGRIAGLSEMTSSSGLGSTQITLQFDLSRDVDSAARDVQAAINASAADLPPNLPSVPNFQKVNPSDAPILILTLHSDTIPLAQVYDAANTILAQKISQVPGVGQVFVGGGQNPAVRVQADPVALAGRGLTLEDVRLAMVASSVDQPKGSLAPNGKLLTVQANDQILGAAKVKDLVIAYQNGAPVHLTDVANVIDSVENERVAAWTNGVRSILIIIRRQPGANIIETNDRVKLLLPDLASSISPAIQVAVAVDRTQSIRASVQDVERTLVISVFLVVLVVYLFLRSARATVIPSVAVPLSLLGTFGAMYFLNYSLDNLSLMALTIATGFVVDDAIVVTENVSRLLEEGMPPIKAALEGARQIGFTIISITISLLAVFIPILLMGGVVGRLFREFAITLSISIGISAVISLTLTPMMCSRILRDETHEEHHFFYRLTERGFQFIHDTYAVMLTWVLKHRALMQLVTAATIGFTVYLFFHVPGGLFPQQDAGQLSGSTVARDDISFPAMKRLSEQVNAVVAADPDVDTVTTFIGGGRGGGGNQGNMFIGLKDKPPRKISADSVVKRIRPKLNAIPGIKSYLQASQDVRVGGRSSAAQYQFTMQSANLDDLLTWAPRVLEELDKVKILKDVNSDQHTAGLQLNVNIDRDSASRLGIAPSDIDAALYDSFGQNEVMVNYTQMNQYHVVLEAPADQQTGPEGLRNVYVKSPKSGPVPLSALSHITSSQTSLTVNHQGQFPSITISFNLDPGMALGDAVKAVSEAERKIGMPASVLSGFQGTAQVFQQSLANEPFLILSALIAVYIVLGMLYESLIHPITILSTLPSAGVGALLALKFTGGDLNLIALIGLVLLIGIVKKNAIMMIDCAIEVEREQGLTPEKAIYEACLRRLRPILMTTMAALLGAIPLAIGGGVGSELRKPLGITIVGGLIFSQAITLFTTPVIYLALEWVGNWLRETFGAPAPRRLVGEAPPH